MKRTPPTFASSAFTRSADGGLLFIPYGAFGTAYALSTMQQERLTRHLGHFGVAFCVLIVTIVAAFLFSGVLDASARAWIVGGALGSSVSLVASYVFWAHCVARTLEPRHTPFRVGGLVADYVAKAPGGLRGYAIGTVLWIALSAFFISEVIAPQVFARSRGVALANALLWSLMALISLASLAAAVRERRAGRSPQFLEDSPLLEAARRYVERHPEIILSDAERVRLTTEPSIEISVDDTAFSLTPILPGFDGQRHLAAIAAVCEGVGWRVTNSHSTRTDEPTLGEIKVAIYHLPVQIARAGQHFERGWDAAAVALGTEPRALSLNEFAELSRAEILSSLSHEDSIEYFLGYLK